MEYLKAERRGPASLSPAVLPCPSVAPTCTRSWALQMLLLESSQQLDPLHSHSEQCDVLRRAALPNDSRHCTDCRCLQSPLSSCRSTGAVQKSEDTQPKMSLGGKEAWAGLQMLSALHQVTREPNEKAAPFASKENPTILL